MIIPDETISFQSFLRDFSIFLTHLFSIFFKKKEDKKEKGGRKTIKLNQNDLFVQCRNGGRQLLLSA